MHILISTETEADYIVCLISTEMSSVASADAESVAHADAESKLMALWHYWLQHNQNVSAVSRLQNNEMRHAVFFDRSDNQYKKKLTISVDQDANAIWLTPLDHKHLALSDKSVPNPLRE